MKRISIDHKDCRILGILQREGRITNQALAQRVHLSASACLERVRRLEKQGTIRGYGADVDIRHVRPTLLLFGQVSMIEHGPRQLRRFEALLSSLPQVIAAAQVSGTFDYMLTVVVCSIDEWRELSDRLLGDDYGVASIATSVQMLQVKRPRGFPLDPAPALQAAE